MASIQEGFQIKSGLQWPMHYGQIHYIRVYEKSNFKSLIIGNLHVKLLAFLEKDPC